jgi:hypothetical protein
MLQPFVHRLLCSVAGNPWHCDCDRMYTVYRTFWERAGQNLTLWCESPAELGGKSWDVLEDSCQPTVTPTTQAAVTSSTANTTAVSTSQSVQFNTIVQRDVSVQESSQEDSHSSLASLVISLCLFALAVYTVVFALILITRQWQVTCSNDSDRQPSRLV